MVPVSASGGLDRPIELLGSGQSNSGSPGELLSDLLVRGFWLEALAKWKRRDPQPPTSLLCVTGTLECLCSVSFGTLVSAWGAVERERQCSS